MNVLQQINKLFHFKFILIFKTFLFLVLIKNWINFSCKKEFMQVIYLNLPKKK